MPTTRSIAQTAGAKFNLNINAAIIKRTLTEFASTVNHTANNTVNISVGIWKRRVRSPSANTAVKNSNVTAMLSTVRRSVDATFAFNRHGNDEPSADLFANVNVAAQSLRNLLPTSSIAPNADLSSVPNNPASTKPANVPLVNPSRKHANVAGDLSRCLRIRGDVSALSVTEFSRLNSEQGCRHGSSQSRVFVSNAGANSPAWLIRNSATTA